MSQQSCHYKPVIYAICVSRRLISSLSLIKTPKLVKLKGYTAMWLRKETVSTGLKEINKNNKKSQLKSETSQLRVFYGSNNERNNLSSLYFKPSGGFWAALLQGPSPPMTSHHCVTMHSKINNGVLLCLNGIVSSQTNYYVIRSLQWIKATETAQVSDDNCLLFPSAFFFF